MHLEFSTALRHHPTLLYIHYIRVNSSSSFGSPTKRSMLLHHIIAQISTTYAPHPRLLCPLTPAITLHTHLRMLGNRYLSITALTLLEHSDVMFQKGWGP